MNKEENSFSKDPDRTTESSLDNSAKNTTGIKNSMIVSDLVLNKANETKESGSVMKREQIKMENITSNNTLTKIGNQVKLTTNMNKQISGTIAKNSVTGQYVLIQPGGGTPVPVRLTSNNGNTNKPVAVQVIRKSDGTLVPIKSNKQINLSNVNLSGKKIITGSGQTILLNKSASVTGNTNTTTTSLIKTSAGSPNTDQIQKPVMKTISISGDKAKYLTTSPAVVNVGNKFVVRTDNSKKSEDSLSQQVPKSSSQKFIKLSPSTSTSGMGNVQTLQLSSKSGGPVQYVRVLNTGVHKESLSPTKVFVKNQDGHLRMVTKINQQPLLDGKTIIVKDNPNKTIQEQFANQKLTTVPTLRKISDPLITSSNKFITIKKEEVDQLNIRLKQKTFPSSSSNSASTNIVQKPRILNNLGRLTGNLSVSTSSDSFNNQQRHHILNKKDHISGIVSSTNLNKSTVSNIKISPKKLVPIAGSHHTLIRNAEPRQQLYTVLKPSSENIQEKILIRPGQKTRSPSPSNQDGGLRRKHCNCTKSQCLKLYCDCFANGEFCQDCNCKECFNNLEYEDERQKAIKMCLERNPAAFKPKITKARDQNDLRLHNKGCNCKRSGCLKNYCECYEAKIACSSNCKCIGCRNVEDRTGLDMTDTSKLQKNFARSIAIKRPYEDIGGSSVVNSHHSTIPAIGNKISSSLGGGTSGATSSFNEMNSLSTLNQNTSGGPPAKQAYNFITQDVVDATIQCMIAQADECQKGELSVKATERMILEELGRCLVEIIDFSIKNFDN